MRVSPTEIEGVLEIEPRVHGDARGYFVETYSLARYAEHGVHEAFVQDNLSRSEAGIVRGLHLQHPRAQGKLVWVLGGSVLDVAVDVRVGSPTFGAHVARVLEPTRKNQLWVPPGFAHGFAVLEGPALVAYKCTAAYSAKDELSVQWCDPDLGIDCPVREPRRSDKDQAAPRLRDIPASRLPLYLTKEAP